VAYGYNVNHLLIVQHLVHHAIVPDANAPKILQTLKLGNTRLTTLASRCSSSFRADRANLMLYSDIQLPLPLQRLSNRLQGFTRLIGTLASDEGIIEIFPELTVSFQVNQDSGSLPRCIGDKLNAF